MHASLRSQLVLSCPCILCRAQEALHRLGGPSTPPRRAGSSFCQDDMRHSAGTTRPSRASGVQFSLPSSLRFSNFSPPYFLLLRQSHHDYDPEVVLGLSESPTSRLMARLLRETFVSASDCALVHARCAAGGDSFRTWNFVRLSRR